MATPVPGLGGRQVTVRIKLRSDGSIEVEPKRFSVSKAEGQEVAWVCSDPDAYFTVEFEKNGSPFYESQFSKNSPWSGLVRRNVLPDPQKPYKYTVRVADKFHDPEGVVEQ